MHEAQQTAIRDAKLQDALCIAVLGMQVFLDTYATEGIRGPIAREVLDSFSPDNVAKIIARSDTFIIVAEVNHHLVGFAQVAMRTDHDLIPHPNSAELQRLYVQERFTGKGVGYRLLEEAEKQAYLGGASLLWATVWIGNNRALRFYPRQGYEHLGSPSYTFQDETHENQLFGKILT
ncbi:GNAT family N-acetyltransferase [Pseudomonas japonica]|uniref:GNAT family N-acetyltransferase n=1 Tax=Pseudomonas japonica TaxID=256466 RepID=UPI0015E2EDCE|nr:GNAT family N-acetyltransferase [Pseudomonas japonica]MBA1291427.1 GNAT family N-acetyltransferase [Pseudomonas japonica]